MGGHDGLVRSFYLLVGSRIPSYVIGKPCKGRNVNWCTGRWIWWQRWGELNLGEPEKKMVRKEGIITMEQKLMHERYYENKL